MTAKKLGRPQSGVMTAALKRVLAGETAYRVAKAMGIRHEYLCKRVKLAKARKIKTEIKGLKEELSDLQATLRTADRLTVG